MEEDQSSGYPDRRRGYGGQGFGGGGRMFSSAAGQKQQWARNPRDTPNIRPHQSANWRRIDQQVNDEPQNQQTNASVTSPSEGDSLASQSIAEGRRLYVGNMPYMANTEDVEALFTNNGYKIERTDISLDPFTGLNPSYCFVELETKEHADQAMLELNGKELLGRPVKIGPGVAKSSSRDRPPRKNDRSAGRGGGNPPFVFDRWERTDAADHWHGYSDKGRRLYVGGLPRMPDQPTVNDEIRKLFQGFAIEAVSKIISPHISKRVQPGNHYYLFVDFQTAEEADAAVKALNGKSAPWGGRIIVSKARGDSRRVEERERWEESAATGSA